MRPQQVLATIAAVALLSLVGSPTAMANTFGPNTIAAWVQYTADGVEARAVVTGDCPTISIDGDNTAMAIRAEPTDRHPNYVCFAEIPGGTQEIILDGQELPAPKEKPRRIVVVGDTGCRLSDGHGLYQECRNDAIWPFRYVAEAVQRYEPDIILYTGDYIYREARCPEGNNGCIHSPWGDNLATWEADWFKPGHPIHLAAPIVLVRGNHEVCSRAGRGWFRYLDAYEFADGCANNTPPWTLEMGDVSIGVMDTARVEVGDPSMDLVNLFAQQLRRLDRELGENAWIASHRPFWGFGADDDTGDLTTPDETLQMAVGQAGLPGGTNLIVAAHIHLAEIIGFDGDRPPQLVVANGGTQMVPRVTPPDSIDGMEIAESLVLYQYGFVSMEPLGNMKKWQVSFRDIEGRELERCEVKARSVKCQ
jgi:hypothetical protein